MLPTKSSMSLWARSALLFLPTLVVFCVLIVALFPNRFAELHKHWTTAGDLDMGYLILALFIGLALNQRYESFRLKQNLVFIIPLFVCSGLLFATAVMDIKTLFFVLLIPAFISFCALGLGWKNTQKLIVPIGMLGMVLPFWYLSLPALQFLTVTVNSAVIEWMSITALIEGPYITVPTGIIHVAEGCSGLKYWLSGLTLAFFSASINRYSVPHAAFSVILAAVFALIANWVRVAILIQVGYREGVSHPLMTEHDMLGWVVFGVFMAAWMYVDIKISKALLSKQTVSQSNSDTSLRPSIAGLCIAALLIILPNSLSLQAKEYQAPKSLAFDTNSARLGTKSGWNTEYPGSDAQELHRIRVLNKLYDLELKHFSGFGEGELAKTTNRVFPENWQILSDTPWSSDFIKIRIAKGRLGSQTRVVYYWFEQNGERFNTITASKFALLKGSFKGERAGSLVALSRPCNSICQNSEEPDNGSIKAIELVLETIDKSRI